MMPRMRIPRAFTGALVLVLTVSCEHPVCGCTPARDGAVLYGRVTDVAGNPVANARVFAEEGHAGCDLVADMGRAATDASGRYRMPIHTFGGRVECRRAYALSPAGSTLRGSDTVSFDVRFAAREPLDSARVDLVLRGP